MSVPRSAATDPVGVSITADPAEALAPGPDVWIDYTHPSAVKGHALAALRAGTRVVIGTSGLDEDDYRDITAAALAARSGVIAAGNFSLTAALLKHLAGIAARHLPHREIVDYSHANKPDAPSGTALELAEYLGNRLAPTRWGCRWRRRLGNPPRAAPRSAARRCIRCGCPATWSRSRPSSGCPMNG